MTIGSNLIHLPETDSTNTYAADLLKKESVPEGTVIHADFQKAGRGHQDNKWASEKGKNLLFSIILYPQSVEPTDQFLISMAISLGIYDFIYRNLGKNGSIKWPNDIYSKDDKIAGILIENSIIGNTIDHTVAGIGININQRAFPASLSNATSLAMVSGHEFDREKCLGELLGDLDKRYKQLLYGDRDKLGKEYSEKLYRLDEWHVFRASCGIFTGKIKGVSETGRLIISTRENRKMEFGFKEVEYEL